MNLRTPIPHDDKRKTIKSRSCGVSYFKQPNVTLCKLSFRDSCVRKIVEKSKV